MYSWSKRYPKSRIRQDLSKGSPAATHYKQPLCLPVLPNGRFPLSCNNLRRLTIWGVGWPNQPAREGVNPGQSPCRKPRVTLSELAESPQLSLALSFSEKPGTLATADSRTSNISIMNSRLEGEPPCALFRMISLACCREGLFGNGSPESSSNCR